MKMQAKIPTKIKEKMMANKLYKPLLIDSIKAAENIVQQRFIGFDGKYCKSGAKAFGISDVDTEKDQYLPISVFGILLVEAGGTVAVGDSITSDDNGKAVKAEGSAIVNGYALDNGADCQIIRILIGK